MTDLILDSGPGLFETLMNFVLALVIIAAITIFGKILFNATLKAYDSESNPNKPEGLSDIHSGYDDDNLFMN